MALDLVGEAVHILLQMLDYFIRVQRRLDHLTMFRKFQGEAPLMKFKLALTFVSEAEKDRQERSGAVRYFFQFLWIDREIDFESS